MRDLCICRFLCLHSHERHAWQGWVGNRILAAQGLSDVAWERSGRYLCTASDDQTLRLWDASTGACLRTLEGHTNYVFCCAFNPIMNHVVRCFVGAAFC
jgi:WD40 repeat protein